MKTGASVTKAQLDAASMDVQTELGRIGLWGEDSRIVQTEVFWCWLPQLVCPDALGFFIHEATPLARSLGYHPGHMYIPRWVLSQGLWAQARGSLRDVVRHEYGHAVAHYYPSLVTRSSRFTAVFGGRYSRRTPTGSSARNYVSAYAATEPAEDFAETFKLFVRYKGVLPTAFTSNAIKRKWQFVAETVKVIESGGHKW